MSSGRAVQSINPQSKTQSGQSAIKKQKRLIKRNRSLHLRPINPAIFLAETTQEEREWLRTQLAQAIIEFVEQDRSVWLEGFGLLIPRLENTTRRYPWEQSIVVREERQRTLTFEKCSELTSYHIENYPQLIETHQLAHALYVSLPIAYSLRWNEKDLQRFVRGLVQTLKQEVVVNGHSQILQSIGVFYAMHNRQGMLEQDWYAGADVFLVPAYRRPVHVGPCHLCTLPVLENAWELFAAAYGSPIHTFSIQLVEELSELGYDTANLLEESSLAQNSIEVAVFEQVKSPHSQESILLYCTEGLRSLGINQASGKGFGTELVFQLPITRRLTTQRTGTSEIPLWPARPLTMGWILMHSAASKTVRAGLGLCEGVSLIRDFDTDLTTVFTTPFEPCADQQQSQDGAFYYINILGITDDEARIAKDFSAQHLLTLLQHKGLHQHSKPTRSSIVARTSIARQPNAVNEGARGTRRVVYEESLHSS